LIEDVVMLPVVISGTDAVVVPVPLTVPVLAPPPVGVGAGAELAGSVSVDAIGGVSVVNGGGGV